MFCASARHQQLTVYHGYPSHLARLDLLERGHNVQSHELGGLGDDRVPLHRGDRGDLAVLRLVRDKLEFLGIAVRVHVVKTSPGPEVSKTLANARPEDRDFRVSDLVVGASNVVRDFSSLGSSSASSSRLSKSTTNMVTSNVPVLDSSLELFGILDVMGNVPDGVDILVSLDPQVLVRLDTSVLLEFKAGLLEEARGGSDTGTHDDQVGRDRVLILDLERSAVGRVGFWNQC